ncbi:hypothetical protein ACP70R_038082 [Stipagrostis hirtigluma subsp. patula]
MGNFGSWRMAGTAGTGGCARVLLPGGLVRHMEHPATAAELMLEEPGHFLADERAMRRGRRVEAVRADADLERGVLYAALPMKRLGSPAEAADMARLAASGEKARKRRSTAKVSVVIAPLDLLVASDVSDKEDPPGPRASTRLDEMEVEDDAAAAEIEELKQRLNRGRRSKRVRMDTIDEESYAPGKR